MSDFYVTKELVCDETEPKTYITPVFEFVGDNKLRIHHIDLYSFCNTVKLIPLRHFSKQKQRVFELETENAKLRDLVKTLYGMWVVCDNYEPNCRKCPADKIGECGQMDVMAKIKELRIEVE